MIKQIIVENHKKETLTLELSNPELSGLYVESVDGIGPGKATVNINEIVTSDGGIFASSRVNTRNIILTLGMMFCPQIEDARMITYQYFPIKKPVKLTFVTDKRSLFIEGYVESNEPEIFSEKETTQISILCPNPWFYTGGGVKYAFSGIEDLFEFPFSNEIEDGDYINVLHPISEIVLTQEGSGTPSFDNIRNISGWNKITLTCNGETANQNLPETVYGGSYDWSKGKLTITHREFNLPIKAMVDAGQKYPGWDKRSQGLDSSIFDLTDIDVRDNTFTILHTIGNCLPIIGLNTQNKDNYSLTDARIQFVEHTINPIFPDLTVAELKAQYPDIIFQFVAPLKPEYIRSIDLPVHEFLALSGSNTISADCGPTTFTIEHEVRGDHIIFGDIRQGTIVGMEYKGDVDTGVLMNIRFTSIMDKLVIYNVDTNQSMTLNLGLIQTITGKPLTIHDEIEISTFTGSKYVYLLREGIYYNIAGCLGKNPDWLTISKGINQFAFTAEGHEEAVVIEFQYKDVYSGV